MRDCLCNGLLLQREERNLKCGDYSNEKERKRKGMLRSSKEISIK